MYQEPTYKTEHYISLFQQGDERGLLYLFDKLFPVLVYYGNQRLHNQPLAEEIASTAFIKIWRRHAQMEQYYGIKAYLLKIVERDCIRATAKEKKIRTIELTETGYKDEAPTRQQLMIKAETYHLLYEAIKKLSPGMRAVVRSMYIEGHSLTETAKLLNLNTSTVDTQKKRAIAAIRKLLPRFSI